METNFTPPYKMIVGLDTLWVHVKYPDNELYHCWYEKVENQPRHILQKGIPVDGFVVRLGGPAYDLSIWQGDARVLLSRFRQGDRPSGCGMGILVQLGPKFINEYQNDIQLGVLSLLRDIGLTGLYPMTVSRVDLRVDLLGFPVMRVSPNMLANQWVGRAKLRRTYSEGPIITGYEIGVNQSVVFLRIYDKVLKATEDGSLRYWYSVWGEKPSVVTRFEWQVRSKKAGLPINITNFQFFNSHSLAELGKYLLGWGRLVAANPPESVKYRRSLHPLWVGLHQAIDDYSQLPLHKLKRTPPSPNDAPNILKRLVEGHLSTGMAYTGLTLEEYVKTLDRDRMNERAAYKAQLLKNGGIRKK